MSEIVNSLLDVNNLDYGMPAIPSIATGRTQISVFPQTVSSSQGGNVIFNVSSGTQFIHGPTSYIVVELKLTGGGEADTRINSVEALFSNVVVTAQNGVELCRVNNFPLHAVKQRWKMSDSKRKVLQHTGGIYQKADIDSFGTWQFILRLDSIPIFKNKNLLPPQMMEGLRIQLTVNSTTHAFKSPTTPVTGYSVTPVLKLDAVTLADTFLRRVNEISSSAGLVLMHEEEFHSESTTNSNNLNIAINKACSKATEFVLFSRLSDNVENTIHDSYATEPYNFSSIQLQAGAQYYPIQPLRQEYSATATHRQNTSSEAYHYSLINLAPDYDCSVDYPHFWKAQPTTATECEALFGQNLKEGSGSMTGVLLNNSRSLLVNAAMGGTPVNRLFDAYLTHVRLVRVFSNSIVVRD